MGASLLRHKQKLRWIFFFFSLILLFLVFTTSPVEPVPPGPAVTRERVALAVKRGPAAGFDPHGAESGDPGDRLVPPPLQAEASSPLKLLAGALLSSRAAPFPRQ